MRRHQSGARIASIEGAEVSALRRQGGVLEVRVFNPSPVAAMVAIAAAPEPAGAAGIVPPSNPSVNVSPQVMPACTLTPVRTTTSSPHWGRGCSWRRALPWPTART